VTTRVKIGSNLYQGFAGPLLLNAQGNIAQLQDSDLITQDMIMWLLTGVTEPFMEPQDGVGLNDVLYDPSDPTTYYLLQNYIRERLNELEPRIEVVSVVVHRAQDVGDEAKIIAIIIYKIPALIKQGQDNTYKVQVPLGG
jgi:phage baseplate assembly protein W